MFHRGANNNNPATGVTLNGVANNLGTNSKGTEDVNSVVSGQQLYSVPPERDVSAYAT